MGSPDTQGQPERAAVDLGLERTWSERLALEPFLRKGAAPFTGRHAWHVQRLISPGVRPRHCVRSIHEKNATQSASPLVPAESDLARRGRHGGMAPIATE